MKYERELVLREGWRVPSLTGLLLAAGFILWAWHYVVIALLVVGVGAVLYKGVRDELDIRAREDAERAGLCARADAQHQMVLRGDLAGVYGSYEPPGDIRGMGVRLRAAGAR